MADKEFKYKGKWDTKEVKSLTDFVQYKLDGSDYERGRMEEMEWEIDKLKLVVAQLTKVLYNTDLLTKEEVIEIFNA